MTPLCIVAAALLTRLSAASAPHAPFDIAGSVVRYGTGVPAKARAAVKAVLVDEVNARCSPATAFSEETSPEGGGHSNGAKGPGGGAVALQLNESFGYEAFRIDSSAETCGVQVTASSVRGFVLAAGRLLRELKIFQGCTVMLPARWTLVVDGKNRTRGTQLTTAGIGVRTQQPGAFSTWGNAEQYVKEMAVFGNNLVELSHVFYSDAEVKNLAGYAALLDKYDIDVGLWMPPPMDVTPQVALQLHSTFGNMSRLDWVHMPGGDGGPGVFTVEWLSSIEAAATIMRAHHPDAAITCSTEFFNATGRDQFFAALSNPATARWLTGVTYGKEAGIPLTQFAARLHAANPTYTIKRVPDLSHSLTTGFPVPAWDWALASIQGRETVNPTPARFRKVIRLRANGSTPTIGYAAYSEGLSDDFNKALWSATLLEPSLTAASVSAQYARTYFGADNEARGSAGLFGLEQNWEGPALNNPAILQTLSDWEAVSLAMLRARPANTPVAHPPSTSWRADMHYFRALKDAFIQGRQQYEHAGQTKAIAVLRGATAASIDAALHQATAALSSAANFVAGNATALRWRAQLSDLVQAINTSAVLCPGCKTGSAGTVASQQPLLGINRIESQPLTDAPWMVAQLAVVEKLASTEQKLDAVARLLNRLRNPPLPPPSAAAARSSSGSSSNISHDNSRDTSSNRSSDTSSNNSSPRFYYDWLGSPLESDRLHLNLGQGAAEDPMNFFSPLQSASPCTGRHYPPGSEKQLACVASCPTKQMAYAGV